jgi:hypothetical protein
MGCLLRGPGFELKARSGLFFTLQDSIESRATYAIALRLCPHNCPVLRQVLRNSTACTTEVLPVSPLACGKKTNGINPYQGPNNAGTELD